MTYSFTRRFALQLAGLATVGSAPSNLAATQRQWPIVEGPDTPKICLGSGDGGAPLPGGPYAGEVASDDIPPSYRRIKQIGVDYIMGGGIGGPLPWEEAKIAAAIERAKKAGLTLYIAMIGIPPEVIYGRPGRDAGIENVIKSIQAAGRSGLPVIEYNWYANRLMEGYFEEVGRGGSGHTGFDYDHLVEEGGKTVRARDLPPRPGVGAWKAQQMWDNITYFLKAVIPVAEKAGVRLALHPNDPPVSISRGSQQIMGTVEGWKKLISIVDSPSNGITFDPGVTREMGEDPVEVCRYFASRDRINHAHYRNVVVVRPYERYTEVAPDEGQVDMFGVMKELVRHKYSKLINPEHPRGLDYDRERPGFRSFYPGGGGYAGHVFNVAYARAMLQAALMS
ncbi:MAG: mannonate dehydratase [Bryobacteraceae bacterium]